MPHLSASADTDSDRLSRDLRDVAERHAPEGGYGETYWHPGDKTVFWNAADWTSGDQIDAATTGFLAVDGVSEFDYDFEVDAAKVCSEDEGWQKVWPTGTPPTLDAVVQLAREPLPEVEHLTPPQFAGVTASLVDAHKRLIELAAHLGR
jgi:hypothetical protein